MIIINWYWNYCGNKQKRYCGPWPTIKCLISHCLVQLLIKLGHDTENNRKAVRFESFSKHVHVPIFYHIIMWSIALNTKIQDGQADCELNRLRKWFCMDQFNKKLYLSQLLLPVVYIRKNLTYHMCHHGVGYKKLQKCQ